jgi:hypothetical protein
LKFMDDYSHGAAAKERSQPVARKMDRLPTRALQEPV